jgi:hypothetical protein
MSRAKVVIDCKLSDILRPEWNISNPNSYHLVYENYNYRMNDISSEWFYDSILLKYPSVVFKYRSWFNHINPDLIPDGTDQIKLKQWQIALMIQAQMKAEQL